MMRNLGPNLDLAGLPTGHDRLARRPRRRPDGGVDVLGPDDHPGAVPSRQGR